MVRGPVRRRSTRANLGGSRLFECCFFHFASRDDRIRVSSCLRFPHQAGKISCHVRSSYELEAGTIRRIRSANSGKA
jgi:hypothetical protein